MANAWSTRRHSQASFLSSFDWLEHVASRGLEWFTVFSHTSANDLSGTFDGGVECGGTKGEGSL